MIIAFSIIGLLVLVMIFMFLRSQNLVREVTQLKHSLRYHEKQTRFCLTTLMNLSTQLQNTYLARLEGLQKHALVSADDYELCKFILNHVEFVVMQCCESGATVEEAIHKALQRSQYDMERINKFIARQPSEVRVPWCKNAISGFISACHNLTSESLRLKNRQTSAEAEAPSA
ncbi:hypothetical protein LJ739_14685 [Aestuariibacter halophilus]|uniref:Uncharacterized protein n=1 Tax=Fluctibacter halophilus TaxID=226011 RepID=A0ABS8GA82_9ALTE|nr:hypothetical protein [Aestuariibacter halophilus]MCC2617497.1 hypothetical protein [Aestuariibacter halophilus]